MKAVRIWFQKRGTARYISHLDLNRCFSRAIHKAKIPLWYTQGFNPHAFLTFALPLSLGVDGERESVDIKVDDDAMTGEEIISRLNAALPADIPVTAVTEPVMKPGKIALAKYELDFEPESGSAELFTQQIAVLFKKEEIVVPKHTKKGMVDWNLHPYLNRTEVTVKDGTAHISALLPAGSTVNVSPGLLADAVTKYLETPFFMKAVRTALYDENLKIFE